MCRRRYNFDALSQKDINELVEAKIKKEANRYVQNWPEEKISIENARWGPVLKFGKKILRDTKEGMMILNILLKNFHPFLLMT